MTQRPASDPIIEALAAMVREALLAKRARRRRLTVVQGGKDKRRAA